MGRAGQSNLIHEGPTSSLTGLGARHHRTPSGVVWSLCLSSTELFCWHMGKTTHNYAGGFNVMADRCLDIIVLPVRSTNNELIIILKL